MTIEQLRKFVRKEPFERFTIRTSDGRSFEIRHPDYLALPPEGMPIADVIVWSKEQGVFDFVALKQITSVRSTGRPPEFPQRKRRRGNGGSEEDDE